ncbi:TPA: hypothetical protein N2C61_003491 [Pseudomonas aeruginosa]|uniref:hypothetical protein n=1 Tax=Pseudomonas aeruginosa TaxID=287 RepID=UPI0022DDAFC6|nr:hypothetical protein [Pseudomonas aeruginosa]WBM10934.1 hypothetical protein M1V28_31510 [Pseudomonas aeruginosa]HCL4132384.1 hypothetical protein [Pseudomonas aeruginosa]
MATAMTAKEKRFVEELVRTRGQSLGFVRLGMEVSVSGDRGTVVGLNSSANLDVKFANQRKHGKHAHNCHPTYETQYFDESGKLIASFVEGQHKFSPQQELQA